MGDHFWPSVYPAIAVGIIFGLSRGGVGNVVLATLGALVFAVTALRFATPIFSSESLTSTLALIAVALAGAFLASWLGNYVFPHRSTGPGKSN